MTIRIARLSRRTSAVKEPSIPSRDAVSEIDSVAADTGPHRARRHPPWSDRNLHAPSSGQVSVTPEAGVRSPDGASAGYVGSTGMTSGGSGTFESM